MSQQFFWQRFVNHPKLDPELDQQIQMLTLLKASRAILFLGSRESMLEGHLMFATLTIVSAETGTLQLSGI